MPCVPTMLKMFSFIVLTPYYSEETIYFQMISNFRMKMEFQLYFICKIFIQMKGITYGAFKL